MAGHIFDSAYHYPPELFEVLVEAIPALCKSKQAVLDFFKGAGTPAVLLDDWHTQVLTNREAVKKAEMTRSVLRRLNEGGDNLLAPRRELVKRVSEFQDFSSCWENDRNTAELAVFKVREIVNVKDSFTRMSIERERERQERAAVNAKAQSELQRKRVEREQIKSDLFRLFGNENAHKRGKALEGILNRLFASYSMLVKEAFTVTGDDGQGIIEQIDGAVEIKEHLFLVEMKWWDKTIGRGELAPHLVSVMSRGDVHGVFISASGFSPAAITDAKSFLMHRIYVLLDLQEIVTVLDRELDLREFLVEKIRRAQNDKDPFVKVL